jgi:hypothetical protein
MGESSRRNQSGFERVDGPDDKPIADNFYATLAMLKTLQVTIETWPGA